MSQELEEQVLFCEMKCPANLIRQSVLVVCFFMKWTGWQTPLSLSNCLVYFRNKTITHSYRQIERPVRRRETRPGDTTELSQVG